jgi:hypothetical protein
MIPTGGPIPFSTLTPHLITMPEPPWQKPRRRPIPRPTIIGMLGSNRRSVRCKRLMWMYVSSSAGGESSSED